MKKRKYAVFGILGMLLLLIYPLCAEIYTRWDDDDDKYWFSSLPIGSCPKENGAVDVLLPDLMDCSVFYKCDWGEPVIQYCPDGLQFSVERGLCDWPESVNCDRFWSPTYD